MIELSPASAAFIKVFSLGYLLVLIGLSLAHLAWRLLRPRIAPVLRADIGFIILSGTWLINAGLAFYIWWGVVNGKILMTTHYFCHLMSGGWGNGITAAGLTVLGISVALVAWGWRRGTVPRRLDGTLSQMGGTVVRPASGIATAALVGVARPEVWVNPDYWQSLSQPEKGLALAHEAQHLRRRDNLKKLTLAVLAGLHGVLPWSRSWYAQYELDSELAVDDACRRSQPEQSYRELVADALSFALAGAPLKAQPQVPQHSALSRAGLSERLAILARPRVSGSWPSAALFGLGLCLLGSAHTLALLSHPLPRCFLACYLGY
jgi:hypothetical protein